MTAIGEVVAPDQVHLYDGHELFSSASLRAATQEVLVVLAEA